MYVINAEQILVYAKVSVKLTFSSARLGHRTLFSSDETLSGVYPQIYGHENEVF